MLLEKLRCRNFVKAARFPVLKTLEQFRWDWPKKINRLQVQHLFRLEFLAHKGNVVFLGTVTYAGDARGIVHSVNALRLCKATAEYICAEIQPASENSYRYDKSDKRSVTKLELNIAGRFDKVAPTWEPSRGRRRRLR